MTAYYRTVFRPDRISRVTDCGSADSCSPVYINLWNRFVYLSFLTFEFYFASMISCLRVRYLDQKIVVRGYSLLSNKDNKVQSENESTPLLSLL